MGGESWWKCKKEPFWTNSLYASRYAFSASGWSSPLNFFPFFFIMDSNTLVTSGRKRVKKSKIPRRLCTFFHVLGRSQLNVLNNFPKWENFSHQILPIVDAIIVGHSFHYSPLGIWIHSRKDHSLKIFWVHMSHPHPAMELAKWEHPNLFIYLGRLRSHSNALSACVHVRFSPLGVLLAIPR